MDIQLYKTALEALNLEIIYDFKKLNSYLAFVKGDVEYLLEEKILPTNISNGLLFAKKIKNEEANLIFTTYNLFHNFVIITLYLTTNLTESDFDKLYWLITEFYTEFSEEQKTIDFEKLSENDLINSDPSYLSDEESVKEKGKFYGLLMLFSAINKKKEFSKKIYKEFLPWFDQNNFLFILSSYMFYLRLHNEDSAYAIDKLIEVIKNLDLSVDQISALYNHFCEINMNSFDIYYPDSLKREFKRYLHNGSFLDLYKTLNETIFDDRTEDGKYYTLNLIGFILDSYNSYCLTSNGKFDDYIKKLILSIRFSDISYFFVEKDSNIEEIDWNYKAEKKRPALNYPLNVKYHFKKLKIDKSEYYFFDIGVFYRDEVHLKSVFHNYKHLFRIILPFFEKRAKYLSLYGLDSSAFVFFFEKLSLLYEDKKYEQAKNLYSSKLKEIMVSVDKIKESITKFFNECLNNNLIRRLYNFADFDYLLSVNHSAGIIKNKQIAEGLLTSIYLYYNVSPNEYTDCTIYLVGLVKAIERYIKEILVQYFPRNIYLTIKDGNGIKGYVCLEGIEENKLTADHISHPRNKCQISGYCKFYKNCIKENRARKQGPYNVLECGSAYFALKYALNNFETNDKKNLILKKVYSSFINFNNEWIQKVRNGYLHVDKADADEIHDLMIKTGFWFAYLISYFSELYPLKR